MTQAASVLAETGDELLSGITMKTNYVGEGVTRTVK